MCLKHNTRQTVTRGLGVQDSPCSRGVTPRLSQQKLDFGGIFRIPHISLGMGWGWDFLLHWRNGYLKGRSKTDTQRMKARKAEEVCWVFSTYDSIIVVSFCGFCLSGPSDVFIAKAQLLPLTLPFIWGL